MCGCKVTGVGNDLVNTGDLLVRANVDGQGHLPTLMGLSHELRIMIEEGDRVWHEQKTADATGSVER
jgi:hypothetical protein